METIHRKYNKLPTFITVCALLSVFRGKEESNGFKIAPTSHGATETESERETLLSVCFTQYLIFCCFTISCRVISCTKWPRLILFNRYKNVTTSLAVFSQSNSSRLFIEYSWVSSPNNNLLFSFWTYLVSTSWWTFHFLTPPPAFPFENFRFLKSYWLVTHFSINYFFIKFIGYKTELICYLVTFFPVMWIDQEAPKLLLFSAGKSQEFIIQLIFGFLLYRDGMK